MAGSQPQAGVVARRVGLLRTGTQPQAGAVVRTVLHMMAGTQAQFGLVTISSGQAGAFPNPRRVIVTITQEAPVADLLL